MLIHTHRDVNLYINQFRGENRSFATVEVCDHSYLTLWQITKDGSYTIEFNQTGDAIWSEDYPNTYGQNDIVLIALGIARGLRAHDEL